jgi:PAS domain S-box-containing protein
LIVEDEPVISMYISATMSGLGYEVVGSAVSGEAAVEQAARLRPDLILMDIHLATAMDGIQAANAINAERRTPVVYLTAYSDDETLQRAKLTEPFGYAVKPFNDRELHILVEIALYKSDLEAKLRKSEETLSAVLRHMTDAVILTDANGRIIFLNKHAELLTGFEPKVALGEPLRTIADITMGPLDASFKDALDAAIKAGQEKRLTGSHTRIRDRIGGLTRVDGVLAPQVDENGQVLGAILVLRDLTHADRMNELVREVDHLKEFFQERVRELI